MEITIGGKDYKAEFNAFTPIVFSRNFKVDRDDGKKRPKDIAEDVAIIVESMDTYGFPPIVPLLEILYACIKTADLKCSLTFDELVSGLPANAYDLTNGEGWAADVMKIVQAEFFPGLAKRVDAKASKEPSTTTAQQS